MEGGSNWWYKPASGDEAASFPWPAVEAAGTGGEGGEGAGAVPAASGSRRYYECDICKGGFTTAQALGGHMNIHRRGRASRRSGRDHRDAHTGVVASASRTNTERYGQYGDMASYPPAPMISGSFAAYYPGAAASTGDAAGTGSPSPRELSLFGANTHHRHDLGLGLGHGHHGRGSRGWSADGSERQAGEPEGMDLELRLGRRSGWY